ncbi:MAG TPA: two-component regulator propeller domain-containing protein [Kofleriaceae bacterium]|nr:two-component regulator propeller domain-containing protein [Kofleriaceae bacterium]
MVRRFWILGVALAIQGWLGSLASAQVTLPPTDVKATGDNALHPTLQFDRVTGMTKGAVAAIAQDASGFIWFGTEEGLSRFDGYDFVSYMPGAENTLSNFTVTSLVADAGSLWIGTAKGLDRLDLATNKFTHYKNNPQDSNSIASDFIASLALSKTGALWVATDAGLDSLDPKTGEVKHFRSNENRPDSLGDDALSVVFEDVTGKIWVGLRDAGLDRLDPQTGKFTHFRHDPDDSATLTGDSVTSIYQDKAGMVWIGTMDGLTRFDPATSTFKAYFTTKSPNSDPTWITTIAEGAEGGLWLGVKGIGVYRLDRKTGQTERYLHDSSDVTSIAHPWLRVAFSDRGGVLWFGFQAGGVSKLYPLRTKFAFYRTNPGLAFLEDGDRVWLGTQGRGLRSLDLKTGEVKNHLDEALSSTWTMKIIEGEKGSLWLATTDRGLYHYTPKTGVLDNYDIESGLLKSDAVFALFRDGDMLWIGSFGAGLAKFDTVKKTASYFTSAASDPTTLSSDYIVSLHKDVQTPGMLWVGTAAGLNLLDTRSGKVVRYLHDPAKPTTISNDHITDVYEDKKGRLWVSTWGGGLDLLDRRNGTFTALRAADGLASDVVYGILEDRAGMLWLTTNDGLTKLDPETKKTTTFRAGDGLQGDEFAQGGFYQGPSGRFYVGGPRGFNVFVPEQIEVDTNIPPIALTKFELAGESRPIPQQISLGFRDRWFAVTFAALAYASPQRNHYKYRLKGFHDWTETDRRYVSYSSLPPGTYTLEILGSNAHGVWNSAGIKVPIRVRPPPWRTWWAYAGYCIFVAVIIGLIWRRQKKQLSALQQAHRLSELEREIELTSAVQEGFFPSEPSVRDGLLRLEGFYRAASQCSGDWWWYEARGDSYFILVGDVTGHGAGSAMVTAAAASCFRSLGNRVDDDARLQEMNEEVLRVSRGQYHMTLTALTLDVATGEFTIRSAGGVPVFSLPPTGRTKVHMCPGMPLGSTDFQAGVLEGQLTPGERILIMTDGIPEVAMSNAQLLGPRGVSNFYMQTRDQDVRVALDQLIKKVEAVQAGSQDDDWTAVMLQWGNAKTVVVQREEDRDTLVRVAR